jgi:hypothetical protein
MGNLDGGKWLKGVVWVVTFVVGFVAAKAITQYFFDKHSNAAAVAAAEKNMDKLREEGAKKHPDLLPSEAMKQEATEQGKEELAKHSADKNKQAKVAADQFLGFLLVNTRTRVDYCKELGVDIAPFKAAFERAHRDEIARAAAIHHQRGRDMAKDGEKLYGLLEGQFRKIIETDMRDAAKQLNTDQSGACKAMAELATGLVEEMQLQKSNPVLHKALMSYE